MSAFISGLSNALGGSSFGQAAGSTIGSGLIGGIKTAIGNALNKRAQNRAFAQSKILQELQYKYNMALAQQAYDHQLDFWNVQNEYNTPANQRKRLEAAGLNPALMYGAGQGGNVAGGLSSVPNPSVGLPAHGNGMPTAVHLDPLTASQARLNNAQARKISSETPEHEQFKERYSLQNSVLSALKDKHASDTDLNKIRQSIEAFNLGLSQDLRSVSIETAKRQLDILDSQYIALGNEIVNSSLDAEQKNLAIIHAFADMLLKYMDLEYYQENKTSPAKEMTEQIRASIVSYLSQAGLNEETTDWLDWKNISSIAFTAIGLLAGGVGFAATRGGIAALLKGFLKGSRKIGFK